MSDRSLDFDDIQGNVLGGFNTDIQILLGLTVQAKEDFPRAAKWLAGLADSVTVVSEMRANRAVMKSAPADPAATWLCVALGPRVLTEVRSDVLIRDDAFQGGMVQRAPSVLGDRTDPSKWRVGGRTASIDALLIVAANNEGAAAARAATLGASAAAAGLTTTYQETGRRLNELEHFGFRDGISQPKVIGVDPDGVLGPGHFVFGYPKAPGLDPFWPVVDPTSMTDNGSLLVFRRLAQNVRAFRDFCEAEAARIAPNWPGLSGRHLQALLVGRWPSGAPVKNGEIQDPGSRMSPENGFDFHDDPEQRSCPFGAHIRKVNPRNGPKDVVEVPRMLRRGIPFGFAFSQANETEERGLFFLSFQSSLKAQFEFLTRNWMNSDTNPGKGNDLLVGRSNGVRTVTIPGPAGPIDISAPELNWIVPTGGAYLFAPGRTGLRNLAAPATPLGLWKARQLLAIATDSVKATLFD